VFLIDSRSRSAKEILAYRIRHENVGTLVGEKTEGAVLGAMFHPLPDGSYLELPGVAVPVNGVSLEGVGVEPDVRATVELPYAQGLDGILEAGLDVAVEKVRAWRRGPY
jgi:carboxyl-terminal processing protease